MLPILMKWASVTLLLLAGLWPFSGNSELVFEIVLCAGVIPVVLGSIRAGRPQWAVGFIAIALVFNLIEPVRLSHAMILWMDLTCVAALIISLAVLAWEDLLQVAKPCSIRLEHQFGPNTFLDHLTVSPGRNVV